MSHPISRRLKTAGIAVLLLSAVVTVGRPASGSRTLENSEIELTFLANAGVLLKTENKTILIDALFDKPNPEYEAPSAQTLEIMRKGESPFQNIDLVLVTHNHPDHFSATIAAGFLLVHPNTIFLAAGDTVSALKEQMSDWEAVSDRFISFDLEPGEKEKIEVNDLSITVIRTLHSGERDTPHNLMFLFTMDGRTIFHEGDSDGTIETFNVPELTTSPIDLALVHYWFPFTEAGRSIILEILKPKNVGLIHLPVRLKTDAPEKIDLIRAEYKNIFLLMNPGEKIILN
ncbi:MAG: MBL fold metallo-hydrolase [Candidatus Aminicenantes bacterium]|nr:MBL fold metallo-hydrolase [Candidatus Aminicenantes bacterium]